ncbi:MAG: hypothetical protein AAF569_08265 [Pseudomonadota bacterium]
MVFYTYIKHNRRIENPTGRNAERFGWNRAGSYSFTDRNPVNGLNFANYSYIWTYKRIFAMFSRLEPLFLKQFRQAESTDTRQAIRDEPKDQRQKKDEEQKRENNQDLWTDNTSVSVESLKAFLIAFLKDQIEQDKTAAHSSDSFHSASAKPATTIGGHAVQAYQSMARRNEEHQTSFENTQKQDANSAQSEDIRKINHLIRSLDSLDKKGVKELVIPKAGTFLESIELAVKTAQEI